MNNDVIPHVVGQLDQAPVERNGAVARAGTPTAPLVADDNMFDVRRMFPSTSTLSGLEIIEFELLSIIYRRLCDNI